MQVTKVETAGDMPEPEENGYDDEQLMRDLNCYRAEALAKKLLKKGLSQACSMPGSWRKTAGHFGRFWQRYFEE